MGTQQLSITIPDELAQAVRAKVATGEYNSESEVVEEGLTSLLADDVDVEQWLQNDVAAAYDGFQANPAAGCSGAEMRTRVAEGRDRVVRS